MFVLIDTRDVSTCIACTINAEQQEHMLIPEGETLASAGKLSIHLTYLSLDAVISMSALLVSQEQAPGTFGGAGQKGDWFSRDAGMQWVCISSASSWYSHP